MEKKEHYKEEKSIHIYKDTQLILSLTLLQMLYYFSFLTSGKWNLRSVTKFDNSGDLRCAEEDVNSYECQDDITM